ncbi:MAG: LacI family DNA-binding transcriptional regulator [Velocimicrobium sp.]
MTIKDIAKESGYSVSTVSRVLNKHPDVSLIAKARIEKVVEARNFVPNDNAKHLKQQISKSIAVLVKGTSNMLFANIVEQLQNLIEQSQYSVFVYYLDEYDNEVEEALRLCRERKPLGILFLGGNPPGFKEKFNYINVPCVLVTNVIEPGEFENLSCVGTDDIASAKCAVDYLIQLGHKEIGILGGDLEVSYTSKQRFIGCKQSFLDHNLPFDIEKIFEKSKYSFECSYRAMLHMLSKNPDLTAVFAMSDVMAIGAICALKDRGIQVPEEISVMGFDGIELAKYYNPKLTTIQQQHKRIAEKSVEILLNCIERNAGAVREVTPYILVKGESVREIKK